jgi:hypothetical protein
MDGERLRDGDGEAGEVAIESGMEREVGRRGEVGMQIVKSR